MKREDLQKKLVDILGSSNVYFQPPSNLKMKYPAIVYTLDKIPTRKANNHTYIKNRNYVVTHIYQSPKNELTDKMLDSFQFIKFVNRGYEDGLYNDRYEIYWGSTEKEKDK